MSLDLLLTRPRCLAAALLIAMTFTGILDTRAQSPLSKSADGMGEWPQFLGPARNGLSSETGLIDRWPEKGPRIAWRAPGGVGMSGMAVSRGRVVTMVQREGKQWVVALGAENGQPAWQTPIADAYSNTMGDGPRATPTISGDRVVALTGEGILACVDFQQGTVNWVHNVVARESGKAAEYGMACSPLVVGDLVVVTVGAPRATLVAYDVTSGNRRWSAGTDDPAGYSSPALLTIGGRRQIAAFTGNSALGVDPESGTVLWRFPYSTAYDCNIATPLEFQGHLFLSSGENHGSVLLALKPAAERFEPAEVWKSFGATSVMRNEWQTSILWDGHLYGLDNVGSAGPVTHLTCVHAASGERKWQQARFGKGNLIAADGKLFISTMKGELVVARISPERYDEMGRAVILGSTRQAPSLAAGRLYLRDDQEIVCVDVRRQ